MKKPVSLILLVAIFLLPGLLLAQTKIAYGSNHGKYLTIYNTRIYYEEYGQGTPLLLLQGGMGSIRDFSLCIPELAKHYRVIAPDSPGQGRSGLADSMSYQLMAEYFSKMIDLLKLDSAYIMGWSDGGNTGLIMAYKRPDKIKKILASGANYKLSGIPDLEKDTTIWEKEVLKPEMALEWKSFIDEYKKMGHEDWKKIIIDVNRMWHDKVYFSAEILEGIKIPVMIVLGDRDAVTTEHGLEMHRLIKKSQFCVLPNTSHSVFHERPHLINEIAMQFFGR